MNTIPLADLWGKGLEIANVDLEAAITKWKKDGKKSMTMADSQIAGEGFDVEFEAPINTKGVSTNVWGSGKNKKTTYSVGVTLSEAELKSTNWFIETLTQYMNSLNKEYEVKDAVKDYTKLYVKIPILYNSDPPEFNCEINIDITPKKLKNALGAKMLYFKGKLRWYFNLSDETCGYSLTAEKYDFDRQDKENKKPKV